MAQTLTTKEVAEELGTDPKTFRRFLRSADSPVTPVGQGNRYGIERRQLRTLTKAFNAWQARHTRKSDSEAA